MLAAHAGEVAPPAFMAQVSGRAELVVAADASLRRGQGRLLRSLPLAHLSAWSSPDRWSVFGFVLVFPPPNGLMTADLHRGMPKSDSSNLTARPLLIHSEVRCTDPTNFSPNT